MTLDNLENIFNELVPKIYPPEDKRTFYVCNKSEFLFCTAKSKIAHKNEPNCYRHLGHRWENEHCVYFPKKHLIRGSLSKTDEKAKEFLNDSFYEHYAISTDPDLENEIIGISPLVKKEILCDCTRLISDIVIRKETEKICKSGNFIIGYVDIIATIEFDIKVSAQLEHNWSWDNFKTSEEKLTLVIEAKPELKSWGGPLRQIKTYLDSMKGSSYLDGMKDFSSGMYLRGKLMGIFTTFSEVPERYKKILEAEGVYVVTFSKDGLIEGASPIQTKLGVA